MDLRGLRHRKGLSKEEAAKELGITGEALAAFEEGHDELPVDVLFGMARLYEDSTESVLRAAKESRKAKWGGEV